ncbi:SAS4 Something about silencing protein 4 [Candida maltosa Xu316]
MKQTTDNDDPGQKASRKLRSTSARPKETDKALFDFDNVNKYLYRNHPIKFTTTTDHQQPYEYYGHASSDLPSLPLRSAVTETDRSFPRRPPPTDPLPDSLYDIFHRKMKKNEKQMSNEERIKNLWELDTLQSQLENLNQYDWIRSLPNITKINDPKNYDELERKRELTISEIERLLRKHDNWRKRKEFFNNEVKEYSPFENNEYDMPIETLRKRRQLERRKKYGPIIKVNLDGKYCLVIDPLSLPRIIEIERQRKAKASNSTRLESIDDVSIIDLQIKDNFVYGVNLEEIELKNDGFQLPLDMRRKLSKK